MKQKEIMYKDLDKSTLVRLNKDYDSKTNDNLFKFLQANAKSYVSEKPLPTVIRESGEMVDYTYYHNCFEMAAKDELLRNGSARNFIKKFPGNSQFKIKVPDGFASSYEYYTVNGIYKALELAYCLLLEGDLPKVKISNKYDKEIFYIEFSSDHILSGDIIKENIEDNGEDSLDKILNDLCGLADYVSFTLCDENTAEKMDLIGTRFSKLVKLLVREEK